MIRLLLRSPIKTLLPSSHHLPFSTRSHHPPRHSSKDYCRRPNSTRRPPPLPHPSQLHHCISHLPPRFTSDDLTDAISHQRNPHLCLHLFNWATQQPRFKHDASTYLITIKKLGASAMYKEMDSVATQALSISPGTETLYNTIIYFYTEARMLSKAVGVYKKMRDSDDPGCRPTLRTYNLLFAALLSREGNSYINHMYMDNVRCLFRQMVDSGIEPDIHSLNAVIRGYVLSMHLNDALRVFHQMGVVYKCPPNEHSYNHLVHGLCAQGRTNNARELLEEMKGKGFVPGEKAYNSLVCGLALAAEVDEAVGMLWEMAEKRRRADEVTCRTVAEEMCRQGKVGEAMGLLRELRERGLIDSRSCWEVMDMVRDEYGTSELDHGSGGFRRR